MPRPSKVKLAVVGLALLAYGSIAAFMYAAQEELIFHPTHTAEARLEQLRKDGAALTIDAGDATLEGVLLLGEGPSPRPTLIYFGGNAEPVLEHGDRFAPFTAGGWNVALVPYRGYDQSSGVPSASAMKADAARIYDALSARSEVDPERLVAYGYSIGTGVAVSLASQRELDALLLGAPYARLSDLAADAYPWLPVRALFRHEFDSIGLAPELDLPLLVFHGDADGVIPIEHGRRLVAAWGGEAQLERLEDVGHNGLGGFIASAPETLPFLGAAVEP